MAIDARAKQVPAKHQDAGGASLSSAMEPFRKDGQVCVLIWRCGVVQLEPVAKLQIVAPFRKRLQDEPAAIEHTVVGTHDAMILSSSFA
jgi:hypothetical protein